MFLVLFVLAKVSKLIMSDDDDVWVIILFFLDALSNNQLITQFIFRQRTVNLQNQSHTGTQSANH